MLLERTRLVRDPIAKGVGFPHGAGRPVFLIPGYLAGDVSLVPLARALRRAGYRTKAAGIRLNIGCANEMMAPIEARLEAHVARHGGRRALVIGQSRGGAFGRLLAARRPDLVSGLMTLGTPLLDPLAVHVLVLLNVGLVGTLGTLGLPGLLSIKCTRDNACCESVRRQYESPLPLAFPFASFYSRSDGIVDWRACLDPAARQIEVESSHCGMAWNVDVLRAIGAELARGGAVVG
jgi:pimeloyl-ACP methyl ester carboxylesterase